MFIIKTLCQEYNLTGPSSEKALGIEIIYLGLFKVLAVIKRKFVIIYMLNVSDILLTLLLLQTGVFIEGNFFMRGLVESSMISFVVKLGIPLMLLCIVYKRIKAATEKQLVISNKLTTGCLIFYAIINASHLIWIILYRTYLI